MPERYRNRERENVPERDIGIEREIERDRKRDNVQERDIGN